MSAAICEKIKGLVILEKGRLHVCSFSIGTRFFRTSGGDLMFSNFPEKTDFSCPSGIQDGSLDYNVTSETGSRSLGPCAEAHVQPSTDSPSSRMTGNMRSSLEAGRETR